jgi:hypothetical protein
MELYEFFKDFNFEGMSETEKQNIIKKLLELFYNIESR